MSLMGQKPALPRRSIGVRFALNKQTLTERVQCDAMCRVEMWRGGCRSNISVAASFVWRCLSGSAVTPFPHPAHRTGQADLPHPALGQDFTLSRATPSAASEHLSELIGFPISMSFTTYCVCLELRSLPSTGVTRLQRCRVGGGALDCSCAGLRPPHKLDVQFSRIQLS
jgi:hypothetical protein